jgi:hypothetical protein
MAILGRKKLVVWGILGGPLAGFCVILVERANLLMVSVGIKVIVMVSGNHYWYQMTSG